MQEKREKKLLKLLQTLDAEAQGHLLSYAEYLASQAKPAVTPAQEPKYIAGREDESVIEAIKRLSQCYPMLEKSRLLNDTSALMTQHTLQGRDRLEVIRELEVVFASHYQEYIGEDQDE